MGRRTRFILAVSLGVSRLQLAFRPCRKMCNTDTAKIGPSARRRGSYKGPLLIHKPFMRQMCMYVFYIHMYAVYVYIYSAAP